MKRTNLHLYIESKDSIPAEHRNIYKKRTQKKIKESIDLIQHTIQNIFSVDKELADSFLKKFFIMLNEENVTSILVANDAYRDSVMSKICDGIKIGKAKELANLLKQKAKQLDTNYEEQLDFHRRNSSTIKSLKQFPDLNKLKYSDYQKLLKNLKVKTSKELFKLNNKIIVKEANKIMEQDNFYKSKSIIADRVKLMVKKKELKEVFFKINESKEKITLNDLHISLKKKDYIREFLKNLESADLIQYIIDKRKKFWIPTKKGKELYEALKSGDQIAIFQYCF